MAPLVTSAASAPWCPSRRRGSASHSAIPMTVKIGGCPNQKMRGVETETYEKNVKNDHQVPKSNAYEAVHSTI